MTSGLNNNQVVFLCIIIRQSNGPAFDQRLSRGIVFIGQKYEYLND